ncbi:MAG: hypothetical protein VYC33_05730 [Candidatus Thermoplasmatota archaeon]|nr:hypothetical protein [Candidatus Thermoplasmatota archaeon]
MDKVQVFLTSGLVCTIAFAGFVLLDSDSEYPDWEILEVCLADHSGNINHIHATLSISINDEDVAIPEDVGIQDSVCPNGMRGVHTHDNTGRLHIETPGQMNATIGAFFAIWGEEFDDRHILNHVANDNNEVVMFVNGQQNFEYENYVMVDGDVIEIEYRERQ